MDNALPVLLREGADVLPTHVLQRLHPHLELTLQGWGRWVSPEERPPPPNPQAGGSWDVAGAQPSRRPTTSPRVMWKDPDSVFSYIEEMNSVFRALGTKSARMSILERMRWVDRRGSQ